MANEDLERWENRFGATDAFVFGEAPNTFLVECAEFLPPTGRVLAVADGEGRNGVWLAAQGLDVLSLDFSPAAQRKARTLAARHGVTLQFELADVHEWTYPEAAFDLVVEIFTQFSAPHERLRKWAGMRRTLKPGGRLILQGYTLKQLEFRTGGPPQVEKLYTRPMLEAAFGDWRIERLQDEERDLAEGPGHSGRSAVIGLVARKPDPA